MKKTPIMPVVILSCVPAFVQAQAPEPTPAESPAPAAAPTPAPLPKPAPEVQKLEFLVGDWLHEETFHPGPMGAGGPGKGRSKSAWALGDHHVYTIYTTNSPYGKLDSRGFLGWDPEKKAYRMSWFDNMGMATTFHGDFDAEGALVLNAEYHYQGQPVKERITIRKQADGKVVFSSAMPGPDGAWAPMMDSVASPEAKK